MNRNRFTVAAAAVLMASGAALACTSGPPQPPPTVWTDVFDNLDGTFTLTVGQKISLFQPVMTTNCACGIGIGDFDNSAAFLAGLPASVRIVIAGADDQIIEELGIFSPLLENPNTTNGLNGAPGTNPGSTWFGFFGQIPLFIVPELEEGQMFKMLFDIHIPGELFGLLNPEMPVQFGGGKGNPDGSPMFFGDHPFEFFSPIDPSLGVPSPGAAALALVAPAFTRRRSRR